VLRGRHRATRGGGDRPPLAARDAKVLGGPGGRGDRTPQPGQPGRALAARVPQERDGGGADALLPVRRGGERRVLVALLRAAGGRDVALALRAVPGDRRPRGG